MEEIRKQNPEANRACNYKRSRITSYQGRLGENGLEGGGETPAKLYFGGGGVVGGERRGTRFIVSRFKTAENFASPSTFLLRGIHRHQKSLNKIHANFD